jgi:hypothetical protein
MLISPTTARVSVRDALADAGVDISSPMALASLFVQEEGLTAFWGEIGDGHTIVLSYSGVEVTMFVHRWRVADDNSQVLFEATITDYQLPFLANVSSFFIGSSEIETALQRVMERPLLGHIRAKGNETLLLSLEVDPAFVRGGDPNGMSWRFGLQPGGATTLLAAAECKCCNSGGAACTDDACDGGFGCGPNTEHNPAQATWKCGRYESSGEKDIALCLAPVAACLLWKGCRRMCC